MDRETKRALLEATTSRMRPSAVFALRLRETRKARGLSQMELAHQLTEVGVPLSARALRGIETGERGLSLDEALALADVLKAGPANMLTPPQDVYVAIDDNTWIDEGGLRQWLRHGLPWNVSEPVSADASDETRRERFQLNLARLALALVDAVRAKAGIREAGEAIVAEVKRRERELAEKGDA